MTFMSSSKGRSPSPLSCPISDIALQLLQVLYDDQELPANVTYFILFPILCDISGSHIYHPVFHVSSQITYPTSCDQHLIFCSCMPSYITFYVFYIYPYI